MKLLQYMAILPSSTCDLLCHGMARDQRSTLIYRTSWLIWFCHMSIFNTLFYKISNYKVFFMLIEPYKYLVSRVFHISQ